MKFIKKIRLTIYSKYFRNYFNLMCNKNKFLLKKKTCYCSISAYL